MDTDFKSKRDTFIATHQNWQMDETVLIGGFSFSSFSEVKAFVTKIMEIADTQNHHPTVSFGYNFVRIELTTHDAGEKVTQKDIDFATEISTK